MSQKLSSANNLLSHEKSLYLQQHAHHPVKWFPWGSAALSKARQENKPILLSVGYSACHWCHVMAHECFENPEIAKIMNAHFVNIKVDREERPDIDQIYQNVAQLLTRGGGWPLTVFLTPDLKPFFGGTYFPPEDRYGRPGFPRVLLALADLYKNQPQKIAERAEGLHQGIIEMESLPNPMGPTHFKNEDAHSLAVEGIRKINLQMDFSTGGLEGAPKFPNVSVLRTLLRSGLAIQSADAHETKETALNLVTLTLKKMAEGGLFDQLAGGFHRYSVDDTWSVPHFEKMLYDQGQLLQIYSEVLLRLKSRLKPTEIYLFQRVIRKAISYLLEEMRCGKEGLFYASQDADSMVEGEKEEGAYFVWTPKQVREVLTPDEADLALKLYQISEFGNFEKSTTVLTYSTELAREVSQIAGGSERLEKIEKQLLCTRRTRVPPARDEKFLLAWNALLLSGMSWAALALKEYGDSSSNQIFQTAKILKDGMAQTFIQNADSEKVALSHLAYGNEGKSNLAFLDDYAFLLMAFLDFRRTEAVFESTPVHQGKSSIDSLLASLAMKAVKLFSENDQAGYFYTTKNQDDVCIRTQTLSDPAIPNGTAVLLSAMEALGTLGFDFEQELDRQWKILGPLSRLHPVGYSELFNAYVTREKGMCSLDTDGLSAEQILAFLKNHAVHSTQALAVPNESGPHLSKQDAHEKVKLCFQKTCVLLPINEALIKVGL